MKKPIRHILAISDLHCGSTVGLCPPDFKMVKGGTYGLNRSQQWLWVKWTKLIADAIASFHGKPFALVVNGDLIDGNHHGTQEIWSVNLQDHVNAAIAVLEPIVAKAATTFIVVGTETHTKEAEYGIADHLKAVPDNDNQCPAHNQLNLTVGVHRYPVRFVHHISTTSREHLRASRLSIHLTNARSAAVDAGHTPPKMLVAGHCHVADVYQRLDLACVTLPAWQLLTRYGHRVVPSNVPAVGCAAISFDEPTPRIRMLTSCAKPPETIHL